MIAVAALALAAVAATATPAPGPAFAGVTLGESATALVTRMGDPTAVRTDADGTMYTYVTDRSAGQYVAIFFDRNNAVEVHATRIAPAQGAGLTALGITLGAPETALASLPKPDAHGNYPGADGLLYGFAAKGGIVHRIIAALPRARQTALPASPPATIHGGTSFDDALVIGAATESAGVPAEYAYLDLNPCPGGGTWKPGKQSLFDHGGKPYDVLDVVCSTGGATRSFYFDISRYFGKL
jgi:hypothetical protein